MGHKREKSMKLSIIIPVFNEEENLPDLMKELDLALDTIADVQVEILFVDDGSTDHSLALLRSWAERDPRLRIVSFSRNFGGQTAVSAGFGYSTGDAVTFIGADLQDPPSLIPRFLEQWKAGYEVVWGEREARMDSLATRWYAGLYGRLMRRFALPTMPRSGLDICLVDRRVVEAVMQSREKNTSIVALILWSGFKQAFVPYQRQPRKRGQSKWSLSGKIKLAVDSFVSFSFFPIRLVTYVGLVLSLIGFTLAALLVAQWLFYAKPFPGWTSLMVAVFGLSGVQMLMLGIVAEYLWRTLDESRHRPSYIVRETIGFPSAGHKA